VQRQLRGRVVDKMLVVLRVVAAVKSKGPPPPVAVQIFNLIRAHRFAQQHDCFFNPGAMIACRLSHKSLDRRHMILCQHGRNRIVFGGKLEQSKIIRLRAAQNRRMTRGNVDIRILVHQRIEFQMKIGKRKSLAEIEFGLRRGVHTIAVEHRVHDVHRTGGQGDVIRVCS